MNTNETPRIVDMSELQLSEVIQRYLQWADDADNAGDQTAHASMAQALIEYYKIRWPSRESSIESGL